MLIVTSETEKETRIISTRKAEKYEQAITMKTLDELSEIPITQAAQKLTFAVHIYLAIYRSPHGANHR